jgi:sulfur carrier protein ThiS
MKVRMRNPEREVEVPGPKRVKQLLDELGVNPDTVLVIREKTLITREERIEDADEIEIRPVISGGAIS